jgi:hypothetical protein
MKRLALVLAVSATALFGATAAKAGDDTVNASARTDASQSVDMSSRHRHWRHHHWRRHYGWHHHHWRYHHRPYYRSYGYYRHRPAFSFGFRF